MLPVLPPAILALADGTVFVGHSIGATGATAGEVVFNTSLTGYQEILTDPSYARQIVTLTYPHIGNTGVNPQDAESARVFAAGLVIRDLPPRVSNFRNTASLSDYLQAERMVGIAGIDTRRLTRHLRASGAQNGCIQAFATGHALTPGDISATLSRARAAPSMAGLDLAQVVTCAQRHSWAQGEWSLTGQTASVAGAAGAAVAGFLAPASFRFHVAAYDFGVKRNILRMMAQRGARITVLPAKTPAAEALALAPDGIFLSNGPGDPEPCVYAIEAARVLMDSGIPTFGICLGHQIMALASGAKTFKMKFGHHGANHPVKDLDSGRVSITSQNHGFAVDAASLPAHLRATHISLFDGTLQGLARTDRPAFCFQGHPEASPGPHDVAYLFDRFIALMTAHQENKNA
ncbi:MAG: glutamine-hydrolyzing carbamoyl-phosphate synthase small subunit [Betaproteobacteria bacterium]|nr:glutamine-hydrolyzing carbamoyl-phosphate synthase small subunit [Betaproteobacteria bacterium]